MVQHERAEVQPEISFRRFPSENSPTARSHRRCERTGDAAAEHHVLKSTPYAPTLEGWCDTICGMRPKAMRWFALLVCVAAHSSAATLELRGELTPALRAGRAILSAVQSPFYAEAAVADSRFRFPKLEPGSYTLTVLDPSWGMTRKTVQVTPSFADEHGRVLVLVDLDRSEANRSLRVEGQSTVSVASLKVPGKARAALQRARKKLGRGAEEEGVALLERAVEIAPSFTEAWNELGTIAYKAGDYARAEECFRSALEHEPLAYAPLVNLGGALLSQQRYDEALSFNMMARSMRPEDALANSQLGMNYFYKGLMYKAREYLLRAKEADRGHFSYPQLFLAEVYAKQGDTEEARQELEEMLELHPDAPVAMIVRSALDQLEPSQ